MELCLGSAGISKRLVANANVGTATYWDAGLHAVGWQRVSDEARALVATLDAELHRYASLH